LGFAWAEILLRTEGKDFLAFLFNVKVFCMKKVFLEKIFVNQKKKQELF